MPLLRYRGQTQVQLESVCAGQKEEEKTQQIRLTYFAGQSRHFIGSFVHNNYHTHRELSLDILH
jgi:hypothetical protein